MWSFVKNCINKYKKQHIAVIDLQLMLKIRLDLSLDIPVFRTAENGYNSRMTVFVFLLQLFMEFYM